MENAEVKDTPLKELLSVRDLHVTYVRQGGAKVHAVRGVSFGLSRGETLGIVGESGSGKSSIAQAIMLLARPSGGKVEFKGRDIWSLDSAGVREYRRCVQMVFQDATGSLNPRMTVRATLEEAIRHASSRVNVDFLLDIVGLSKAVLDQYPRELSGGQCQRASFARALAVKPEVLVADEPVSALDVSVQARILNLMRDLRRELNLSVILIAHDLAVVRNVCDRVAVMHNGVFEDFGESEEVFRHPGSAYTRLLLEAVPDVARALAARREAKK